MNHDLDLPELQRLFAAKADGMITPEEHDRLSTLLKDSAAARREWFAFQDGESALLAWAQREAVRREEGVGIAGTAAETLMPQNVHDGEPWTDTEANSNGSHRSSQRNFIVAVAAAIVMAMLIWGALPKSNRVVVPENGVLAVRDEATTSSVAVLSRGVNMEWDQSVVAPAVNSPIPPGTLRLQKGVAEIEFFQGARLCLEGPAEIRLISAGEAFCRYGRFSAHVPPQARGFRINTPKGDIVDLGTEFGLDLNAPSPEVHVFKGEIELHQPQVQTRRLTTGTAAGLDQPGSNRMLVANASAFAFSHDLDARVSASRRAAFEHWQESNAQRNSDADLRLHLEFQDQTGGRSLHNAAAHGDEIAAGTIVGCNWTEGRWPGKGALQFRSVSDRVRLNLPGQYPQFTVAAWVQLHSLNARQSQSSICMSQGLEVGGVHWQVLHDGSLCLGIVAEAHPHVTDDYISPVVFTPDRFGQWVHLAAVFDSAAKEVRFDVNGERLSRHPLKRPVMPKPAMAELGNWIPSPDYSGPHAVRNFVGCMDEFSLFSRALGDEDVRQLTK